MLPPPQIPRVRHQRPGPPAEFWPPVQAATVFAANHCHWLIPPIEISHQWGSAPHQKEAKEHTRSWKAPPQLPHRPSLCGLT